MAEQFRPTGLPALKIIGMDELALKKKHTYRIGGNDLERPAAAVVWRAISA